MGPVFRTRAFFGGGGKAYNIVYVIDRSGSMIDTFDAVRREMKRSIYGLEEAQNFSCDFLLGERTERIWRQETCAGFKAPQEESYQVPL